jgi:predicted MFS family arabinose efflux permease
MVPLELQATGQALLGAVSFGLAVSIASLVGGVIYAQFGAEALFYLATIILLSAIPFAARILRNA